uniref:uncharacterized protein LOC124055033 n=1 Tax=Scatophagus argus TaxID=75038 RepID=UPI001ED826BD|nr:uncharacterized protein LOC124055033 [Scatophagus argus]
MNGSAVNSSSSASGYYWSECYIYDDASNTERPSAGLLILSTTYVFEFLVGAPLNLWLICHILAKRSKAAGVLPADFFPLHLALIQLFFYLVLATVFVNQYVWQSDHVPVLMLFMASMVFILKPLLLCMVCVERYMAVVRPLFYLRFNARQYRWRCLGISWCVYVLMASHALFERTYASMCVLFLPVLLIDTFCCLSILKTLRKKPPGDTMMKEMKRKKKKREEKRETHKNNSEEGKQEHKEDRKEENERKVERSELRGKRELNLMKKKAFFNIAVIQAVLTLNYLPLIITLPMEGLVSAQTLKCDFMALAFAAAASCSYLQPLLHLHKLGRLPCMKADRLPSQNT